jgi:rod shape-determining protein MreD
MVIKQSIFILLVALLSVFIQATFFGTFFPRWLIPNLCMTIIIFLGIFEANPGGALLAFLVGCFLDMASAPLIGPWAGSFVVIFGFLAQGGRRLFVDSSLTILVITGISSFVSQIIYFFLLSQFSFNWGQLISWTLIGSSLFTAILSPFLFKFLKSYYPRKNTVGRFIQQRLF